MSIAKKIIVIIRHSLLLERSLKLYRRKKKRCKNRWMIYYSSPRTRVLLSFDKCCAISVAFLASADCFVSSCATIEPCRLQWMQWHNQNARAKMMATFQFHHHPLSSSLLHSTCDRCRKTTLQNNTPPLRRAAHPPSFSSSFLPHHRTSSSSVYRLYLALASCV